jgi:threonine/homoserine/homoserine lactone efflux protein
VRQPLLAFAVFAAILTVTPGVDTMLVLRTTAAGGRRAGLGAVVGVALGCLVWAVAGALGITAVLAASELAFTVLRVAGVGYLCWLGAVALWQARRSEASTVEESGAPAPEPSRPWRAVRIGLAANLLNPKVGVFYLSVLPQFLPAGLNPLAGALSLAAIHIGEGLVWLGLVVLLVHRARGWLARPRIARRLRQLTGVAFLGFGLRLALGSDRPGWF